MDFFKKESPVQHINHPSLPGDIFLSIKRDDLLHDKVSGNKWRKLKYNIREVINKKYRGIITFGGAFSNHLHAVAAAGKQFQFKTVGIVRGEQPSELSATLKFCLENDMELIFVSRAAYREKEFSSEIAYVIQQFPDCFLLPEGGENELARMGCAEILDEVDNLPDFICVPCGTGTTLSGLVSSCRTGIEILGFPVLKGIEGSVQNKLRVSETIASTPYRLISNYHFGGYAKYTEELIHFIKDFKIITGIPLDQVYTGKMMFGILDLIKKNHFKSGSRILAIHTGGLQGRLPELILS